MADSAIPAALTRRNFRRFLAFLLSWSRDKHKSSTWRLTAANSHRVRMPPIASGASSSSISPSPPSDGGEGWGEEVRFYWFLLSSVLSPLVPRGERRESLMQPWVFYWRLCSF